MKFDDNELYSIPSSVNGTQCSLHDLAKWKNGLAFKKINFSDEGVPVIKIAELNNGIGPTTAYTKEVFSEDAHLKRGDLLFSWSGNPQTSIDTFRFDLEEGWLNQHIFKVTPNEKLVDFDYFYFLMKNLKPYFTKIATNKQTTGLGHVTLADIKRMNLIVPDVETQKRIVSVIKPIDDKIKLNNDINKNLEEQAKALVKSHLIEPTSGNAITPPNWEALTLNDVCSKITDGSHFSPSDVPDGPYPMFSVKDMGSYAFSYANCKHISDQDFQKMLQSDCVPQQFDILVAKDGSYLKEIFMCPETKDEAILSSIAIFRANPDVIIPEFLLYLLKQPSVRKDVGDNYVSGSALPRIVLKDFKKYPIIIPSLKEQQDLGNLLRAFEHRIQANVTENRSLVQLRDSLLPKLMSGEIEVSGLDI